MTIARRLPILVAVAAAAGLAVAHPATAADDDDEAFATARPAAGDGPTRTRPVPPAGAPYNLHFGPTGLCVIGDGFDWSQVPAGNLVLFETSRVLAVKGGFDAETLIEVEPIDQGTSSAFDDELLVRVTVFGAGLDTEAEQVFPMWDTDGGGTIDGKATENTPQSLYLERIELFASQDDRTSVVNDTRVPMHAQGWFDDIATGQDGFLGGDGPDCVEGTLNNDEIYAGGGDDFVRTKDGADIVEGGRGNDTIEGGMGNDDLEGNGGADLLEGGSNDDCLQGGHEGLRDVYDDVGTFDFDSYVAEPGVLNGVEVSNIEYVVDEGALLTTAC